jgi:hypothetical protein
MGEAKKIVIKPISGRDAAKVVKLHHYSGKVVQNSQLHFGVFYEGRCEGAMSFGPSLDKRKTMGLVEGTKFNNFLELNRMAFSDKLPRNSESRAISFALKQIKKRYSHVEWIISFSDATQCGDGIIYRASGFYLTAIKENTDCMLTSKGEVVHTMTIKSSKKLMSKYGNWKKAMKAIHGDYAPTKGFQLRYIYFLNPLAKERLKVPILPFSEIDKMGVGMYKGKAKRASSDTDDTLGNPAKKGQFDSDRCAPSNK